MRDWLNAILVFIGATSLTDDEYNSMNLLNVTNGVYDQFAYDQLAGVLTSREAVSDLHDRLVGIFRAKGFEVNAAQTGKSNIFIGSCL